MGKYVCIKKITESVVPYNLRSIKELAVLEATGSTGMGVFASMCTRIQRVYVGNGTLNDILPFIQQSKNLRKIYFNGDVETVDLLMLNKERATLTDENKHKIAVYVPENIFLETKRIFGNVRLGLVEMIRSNSLAWEHHYN